MHGESFTRLLHISLPLFVIEYYSMKLVILSATLTSFAGQAARNNVLLAVPAFLYAINNYLKFIMQVKHHTPGVRICCTLVFPFYICL